MPLQKKQALKEEDMRERTLNVKDIKPLSSTPVCSPVPTSPLSYSDFVTGLFDSTTTWKQKILWKAGIRSNKELLLKKQLKELKGSHTVLRQCNLKSNSVSMKHQAICFQWTIKKRVLQKHIRAKAYKTSHDASNKRCNQRGMQLL